MSSTHLRAALFAGVVLLAGYAGGLSAGSDTQSTSALLGSTTVHVAGTTVESTPATLTAESTRDISVVNNRSVPYTVRFYVVSEPNPVLDVTFTNGSVLTRPVNESGPFVQVVPFVHRDGSSVEPVRNVSSIRPADSAQIAKWSATVRPESTVSLPTPVERRNVTLLVVVETTATERPLVYTSTMERCDPPHSKLGQFRLTLPSERNQVSISSSC